MNHSLSRWKAKQIVDDIFLGKFQIVNHNKSINWHYEPVIAHYSIWADYNEQVDYGQVVPV